MEPINNSANPALMELVPKMVKRKDNNTLMQRITIEELKYVVEEMEEEKTPGSDRFNSKFIKVCWDIVQKDLFKMV